MKTLRPRETDQDLIILTFLRPYVLKHVQHLYAKYKIQAKCTFKLGHLNQKTKMKHSISTKLSFIISLKIMLSYASKLIFHVWLPDSNLANFIKKGKRKEKKPYGDNLEGWNGVGGRFEREGTHVYLWLIHVDVWQKTTEHCKATILQLKRNKLKQTWWKLFSYVKMNYEINIPSYENELLYKCKDAIFLSASSCWLGE